MDIYRIRNLLSSGKSIFELPLRVTYYARVSTEKFEQASSLKNQVEFFSDMISKNENWRFVEGFIDEGISGSSTHRRESFLKMIDEAKKGKFDLIITKEISRFSRSTLDSIKYTQLLLGLGVGVLFLTDNINTLMPDSELRLTIMSSIAQEEVRKISERIKFGLNRSIEKGKVLGNENIWGYSKKDGRLSIDEEEAKVVRLIFELYALNNLGIRGVSSELEKRGYLNSNNRPFSFSVIKSILTNPKYKGWYCGNKSKVIDYRVKNKINLEPSEWVIRENSENVPPIVSEELWEKANRILKGRSGKKRLSAAPKKSSYPLSGKVLCANHQDAYHRCKYKTSRGTRELWQCKHYKHRGRAGCENPSVYTDELVDIVWVLFLEVFPNRLKVATELLYTYKNLKNNLYSERDINLVQKQTEKMRAKRERLLDLFLEDKISEEEYSLFRARLTEEIESLEQFLESRKEESPLKQQETFFRRISDFLTKQLEGNKNLAFELADCWIESITVFPRQPNGGIPLRILTLWKREYFKSINIHLQPFNNNRKSKCGNYPLVSDNTYDKGRY